MAIKPYDISLHCALEIRSTPLFPSRLEVRRHLLPTDTNFALREFALSNQGSPDPNKLRSRKDRSSASFRSFDALVRYFN
jgi:hypothetical protein